MQHIRYIDGLRALSVLAVLLYHLNASLLPGGFIGVDVFFVVSGFVVTGSLSAHRDERPGAYLARFYARRLARLMPGLVAMLLATTLAFVLLVPAAWFNRAAQDVGLGAFWGISNWILDRHTVNYFEPRAELNPFTHTWSLGVEEQFYLVAPLLIYWLLASRRSAGGPRHALRVILVLALASLAACLFVGVTQGPRHVFYPLAYRFWELAAGVLLFVQLGRVRAVLARLRLPDARSAWTGLALVLLMMALPHPEAFPYLRAMVAVAGTLLLLSGDPHPEGERDALRRALAWAPAVWLGERSYGLYLWHWPVYVLARWTVGLTVWPQNMLAVGLSLALATVSYACIEHPVRSSPRLNALPPALRIGLLLCAVGLGWGLAAWLHDHQRQLSLGQPARQAADWYDDGDLLRTARHGLRRCAPQVVKVDVGRIADAGQLFVPTACADPARPRLIVIGDSHAKSLLPLFEQLSAEEGRQVEVYSAPGCGMVDLLQPMDERKDADCYRFAQDVTRRLQATAQPGDIVFLSSLRLPRLVHLGGQGRVPPPGATTALAMTVAEREDVRLATIDAQRWLDPLTAAGLRVVLEAPEPLFAAHPFACVDAWNRGNPDCAPGLVQRRDQLEAYRAPVMQALASLTSRDPALLVWDPLPLLCSTEHCAALRDGRPLFFDADHLSPYGNLLLLPAFRQWLATLARP